MTNREQIKEYHKSLLVGDRLEELFKRVGIKWLVKLIYPNCNCDERKEWLNQNIKLKRK